MKFLAPSLEGVFCPIQVIVNYFLITESDGEDFRSNLTLALRWRWDCHINSSYLISEL